MGLAGTAGGGTLCTVAVAYIVLAAVGVCGVTATSSGGGGGGNETNDNWEP